MSDTHDNRTIGGHEVTEQLEGVSTIQPEREEEKTNELDIMEHQQNQTPTLESSSSLHSPSPRTAANHTNDGPLSKAVISAFRNQQMRRASSSSSSSSSSAATPGAQYVRGRAFGLQRIMRRLSPLSFSQNPRGSNTSLPEAILVEDAEVVSIRRDSLVTDAVPVLPLYRQKRVWILVIVIVGLAVAVVTVILLNESSSDDPSHNPAFKRIEGQRLALEEFFNSSGGINWKNKSGWDNLTTTTDFCSWHGVICNNRTGTWLVGKLMLSGNNLTGNLEHMSSSLIPITTLERVNLSSNNLEGSMLIIGELFAKFKFLKEIKLMDNALTGNVAAQLCSKEKIKVRVDCDVDCDCCSHETLCETCADVPGWVDILDNDCNS